MPHALLITGASGFVGSHAVKYALNNFFYDNIIATDLRKGNGASLYSNDTEFQFLQPDFTSPDGLAKIRSAMENLRDYKFVIWHIGGLFNYSASASLLYKVNVIGTRNLMTMLQESKFDIQRFIFWSGGVVYGDFNHPDGKLPASEEYPIKPQDDYGWSKKSAEDWILFYNRTFHLPTTIMRLGAIYGPNSRYGMACAILLNASGQLAPLLVGDKENMAGLIHAEDVVRVADFLSWAEEANGEIYNVVDNSRSVSEVAKFIGEQVHNKPFGGFRLPAWVLKTLIKLADVFGISIDELVGRK